MPDDSHLDENGFVVLDMPDPDAPDAVPAHVDPTAIAECDLCDDDGYLGARVCDHREHSTPEARQAARDALREALQGNYTGVTPPVAQRCAQPQHGASVGDA